MRFFFLGAVASALVAVAAAVPLEGNPTPEESLHMKESILSLTKAIDTKSCDVARSQVMCLKNLIHDRAIQGYVEGTKDEVKYVTMEDGDKIVNDLWKIRLDHEQHKGRDEGSSRSQKPKGGKGGKGKGGMGGKGKAKGRPKGGKGKGGQGKGGQGKGGQGKGGRSLDEEEAVRPGQLSCGAAHKILKVVRETAPKTVKFGTTMDDKCAFFVNAKEEKALKSKIRKALLFSR